METTYSYPPMPTNALMGLYYNRTKNSVCILVQLLPRIIYHTNDHILDVLYGTSC